MIPEIIKAASVPLAMIIVGALAAIALAKGIDGAVFMTGAAIIGGLGGYEIKNYLDYRKRNGKPPKQ